MLEARNRVGGRLLSRPTGLDLGATWFWPNEPLVNALINELGLVTFRQHIEGDAIFQAAAGVQRIDGNPIDVPSGRFHGGAEAFARAVAGRLPADTIRLGEVATKVNASGDEVTVETMSSRFVARHAILALPPALAAATLDFEPSLPDRIASLAAATPVWMGAITKVVACYESAFWRTQSLAGSGVSHVGPMREIHDMSGPGGEPAALFGFAPGALGQPKPTPESVISQLTAMFGPEAGKPLEVIVHDWRTEQFTSPLGVESLTNHETYGHPVFGEPALGGRIHWSSTETSIESPGHIEGALVAAARAVGHILAALDS